MNSDRITTVAVRVEDLYRLNKLKRFTPDRIRKDGRKLSYMESYPEVIGRAVEALEREEE